MEMQLARRSDRSDARRAAQIEITFPFSTVHITLLFDGKIVQFALSSNHSLLSLGESFPAAESQNVPQVIVVCYEA